MSVRKSPSLLQVAGVVFRQQRVFRCYYECNAEDCSPLGSEWVDELLVAGKSWCPCCEREAEPYAVDEIVEERPEFDIEEVE